MNSEFHIPVLLQEVIKGLDVKQGKNYIDATLGGGGHTDAILKLGGKVLGIDVDRDAIDYVRGRWKIGEENLILVQGNFRDLREIAKANGFDKVSGILFDLGVSLHQLKTKERGFSFLKDGPLDMRMGLSADGSVTAADLVNGLYKNELVSLFQKYGEEYLAGSIADAICRARKIKRIETTGELARIVEQVKKKSGKVHPATKVFQALRIAVNDELSNLEKTLLQAVELLEKGGRLAVISFHSLEDRIVKQFGKKLAREEILSFVTEKPIVPTEKEVTKNPRARSSKLRIYAKN